MIRRFAPQLFYMAALGLICFSIFGPHGLIHLRTLNREAEALGRKAKLLDTEVSTIRIDLEKMEKDPVALERRVRARLPTFTRR